VTEHVPGWSFARPRAAYAVVRGEDPQVFIAEDEEVLGRVLALHLVAATPAEELGKDAGAICDALLEERWGDAVYAWMDATGKIVDAYPDEQVWRDADIDAERSNLELRVTPIFRGYRPDDE
jgi:hypothetical protein